MGLRRAISDKHNAACYNTSYLKVTSKCLTAMYQAEPIYNCSLMILFTADAAKLLPRTRREVWVNLQPVSGLTQKHTYCSRRCGLGNHGIVVDDCVYFCVVDVHYLQGKCQCQPGTGPKHVLIQC